MVTPFDFCGDHLAMNFANTVSDRPTAPIERLPDYDAFLRFCLQAQIIDEAQAKRLRREKNTEAVHAEILAVRELFHRVFLRRAEGKEPLAADLASVTALTKRFHLNADYHWVFDADPSGLDAPLGAIIRASLDLLIGGPCENVGICEAETCGWLFWDTSKNHTRRWCEMKTCGNRHKAREHRSRRAAKSQRE